MTLAATWAEPRPKRRRRRGVGKKRGGSITERQLLPSEAQRGGPCGKSSRGSRRSPRSEADTCRSVGERRFQQLEYAADLPIPETEGNRDLQKRVYGERGTIRPQRQQKITASSTQEIDQQDHIAVLDIDALSLHLRLPPSEEVRTALIYARMFTLPQVEENCVLFVNSPEEAYACAWQLGENAPMPLRSTHMIHIFAYVHPHKKPYHIWRTKEKRALGYEPYDKMAWFFPVLISIMDCHGTGAIYNLRRIYTNDENGKRIAAPTLMLCLLRNRNYRWIVADDWTKEDQPVESVVAFYQQLLRNWAGEGLCAKMASTAELVQECNYPSYHDAIAHLVPEAWGERWAAIVDGMTDRQSLASKGPKAMLKQLCEDGPRELREALVAEAAVDNYTWRVVWLNGEVDPERVSETWKEIGKDWQDELTLTLRTRQDAWKTKRYDEEEPLMRAYDAALQEIRTVAKRRALDLVQSKRERSEKGEVSVGIWSERTVEDQAIAFQRIARGLTLFVEITPVMYRQLKARLFFQTRFEYDAPIRDAIRKHERTETDALKRRREMEMGEASVAIGALKKSARELEQTTEQWEREKGRKRPERTGDAKWTETLSVSRDGQSESEGYGESTPAEKWEPKEKKGGSQATLELQRPNAPELLPVPEVEAYDSDPDLTSRDEEKQIVALQRQLLRMSKLDQMIREARMENQRRTLKYTTEVLEWNEAREKWLRGVERSRGDGESDDECVVDKPSTSKARAKRWYDRCDEPDA